MRKNSPTRFVVAAATLALSGAALAAAPAGSIEKGSYAPRPIDLDVFSLLAGILLVAVGLTLTIVFVVLSSTGYALLGGLIPLSIGIGFLAFYLLRGGRRAT